MNTKTKRRKANITDLPYYFATVRGYNRKYNTRFTRYFTDRKLTDSERKWILSYDNTEIGTVSLVQAPEIQHDYVMVYDKCIR